MGDWNSSAAKSRSFWDFVPQFSEIVKVNDEDGDLERMQQMLLLEQEVVLVFRRPNPTLYHTSAQRSDDVAVNAKLRGASEAVKETITYLEKARETSPGSS